MSEVTALPDKLKIKVAGKTKELFMSFGLLNELVGLVGNAAYVGLIPTDGDLSRGVLRAVFAERNERGEITEEPNLYALQISTPDANDLFRWVMGHTLDFFLKSLETAAAVGQQFSTQMEKLFPPSPNGSEGSPSETPSAGQAA